MEFVILGKIAPEDKDEISELAKMLGGAKSSCVFADFHSSGFSNATTKALVIEVVVKVSEPGVKSYAVKAEGMEERVAESMHRTVEQVKEIIAGSLGYSTCTLCGITVRDRDGRKMKPAIPIYISQPMFLLGVRELTLDKEATSRAKLVEKEKGSGLPYTLSSIKSTSCILASLLTSHSLWFYDRKVKKYEIVKEGKHLIVKSYSPPCKVLNRVFAKSALHAVVSVLRSISSPRISRLEDLLVSLHSEKQYRRFFQKDERSFSEREIEVIEQAIKLAPRFSDCRDNFLVELAGTLAEQKAIKEVSRGSYLCVRRVAESSRIERFALWKFLEGQNDA